MSVTVAMDDGFVGGVLRASATGSCHLDMGKCVNELYPKLRFDGVQRDSIDGMGHPPISIGFVRFQ
jgi:hypothetical protein